MMAETSLSYSLARTTGLMRSLNWRNSIVPITYVAMSGIGCLMLVRVGARFWRKTQQDGW